MSAYGTKRTNQAFSCLSAFGGKADMVRPEANQSMHCLDYVHFRRAKLRSPKHKDR